MIGLACYGLDPWVLPFTLRLKHEWLAHEYSSSCAGLGTGDLNPLQSIQRDFEIQPRKKKTNTTNCDCYTFVCYWLLSVCVFFFFIFLFHTTCFGIMVIETITTHWMYSLQRVEDSKCRDGHHGQQAVAQDTGHTAVRHWQGTHQTQQNVHPNTGCGTGPIHITEVNFTCLNMWE